MNDLGYQECRCERWRVGISAVAVPTTFATNPTAQYPNLGFQMKSNADGDQS